MKKSLLALAVLAAFAGVAHAQSNVTVYGIVDMAIEHQNHNGSDPRSVTALDSGIQSGSRLGFKGSEELGNGLKANFQIEMGLNADTGESSQSTATTKRVFGRQAFVGLSGGFGSVNMGRQYSPIFISVDTIDPFDAGFIGGQAGVGTSSGGILSMFLFGTGFRTDNTINYTSNSLGGFTGSAAYSFGEVAGDRSNSRQMGLSGTYAAGPIVATLAYHKDNTDTDGKAKKFAFAGGIYDFGVAKLHAAYGKTTSDLNTLDHKDWMIGTSVPFGAATFLATYTRIKDKTVAEGKSDQVAVGATYSLSKRTNLYTSYSRTANDANANAGGLAAAPGATDRLFNVGIRHKF